MAKEIEVELITGNENGDVSLIQTFFYVVTSTGLNVTLANEPSAVRQWRTEESVADTKMIRAGWDFHRPLTLKMISVATQLGKPKRFCAIYIDVDPKAPIISIKGFENIGGFEGSAFIDLERSEKESKKKADITWMKENLRLTGKTGVKSSTKKLKKSLGKTRRLIFQKNGRK